VLLVCLVSKQRFAHAAGYFACSLSRVDWSAMRHYFTASHARGHTTATGSATS